MKNKTRQTKQLLSKREQIALTILQALYAKTRVIRSDIHGKQVLKDEIEARVRGAFDAADEFLKQVNE